MQEEHSSEQETVQLDEDLLNEQLKELGIQVSQSDSKTDKLEINYILNHLLSYPLQNLAAIHSESNKLGEWDLNKERVSSGKPQQQICGCCGFLYQKQDLKTCENDLQKVVTLGISTYLYFRTLLNLIVLLLASVVFYSIYSLITNAIASNDSEMQYNAMWSISLGAKVTLGDETAQKMYLVQAWLGCVLIIIWGLLFVLIRNYHKEKENKIKLTSIGISQFSVFIEKMPTNLTLKQVQQIFVDYMTEFEDAPEIKVVKYTEATPFYLNQDEFKDKELTHILFIEAQYKQLFSNWILERRDRSEFRKNAKYRQRKYKQFEKVKKRKVNKCKKLVDKIQHQFKKKNTQKKTCGIVTFETNWQRKFILDNNLNDVLNRVKNCLPCYEKKNKLVIRRGDKEYNLRMYAAPDPEDIIWGNIAVPSCQKLGRRFLTYTITLFLLLFSFVLVYFLAEWQALTNQFFISVLTSNIIAIINLIIGIIILQLTKYQRDYSTTNYQISLAIKSIVAQLANSVLVPIIANYFVKGDIYSEEGLIRDVFLLGLSNSLIGPAIKLFDPLYYLIKIYAWYKSKPQNKIGLNQYELNQIREGIEFEVGYEYIYVVNLFLFCCFFVSLQPIIPLFGIIGLALMYWVQKYSLYARSQRPVPGTKIVHLTVSQMLYMGPLAYSLGALIWSNFVPDAFENTLVPNFLSLGLSVVVLLLPYESIAMKYFKEKQMKEINYEDSRIYFTSEYDRLNPATSQEGIQQYINFLEEKKEQLGQQPQMKKKVSVQLQRNRPNIPKNHPAMMRGGKQSRMINNLIQKQSQNMITPQMIAQYLTDKRSKEVRGVSKLRNSLFWNPDDFQKEREEVEMKEKANRKGQNDGYHWNLEEYRNKNILKPTQELKEEYLDNVIKADSIVIQQNPHKSKKPKQKTLKQLQKEAQEIEIAKSYLFDSNKEPTLSKKVSLKADHEGNLVSEQIESQYQNVEKNRVSFGKTILPRSKIRPHQEDYVSNRYSINFNRFSIKLDASKHRQRHEQLESDSSLE